MEKRDARQVRNGSARYVATLRHVERQRLVRGSEAGLQATPAYHIERRCRRAAIAHVERFEIESAPNAKIYV